MTSRTAFAALVTLTPALGLTLLLVAGVAVLAAWIYVIWRITTRLAAYAEARLDAKLEADLAKIEYRRAVDAAHGYSHPGRDAS